MLDVICREVRNYFVADGDKYIGDYAIVDGEITPPVYMQDGQYYRIVQSRFNDDVYIRGQEELKNEATFHGAIWLMRPPKAFLQLAEDIKAWQDKYGGANAVSMSPYTSESFGGGAYSYSKQAGAGSASSGGGGTWQSVFADRLNPYRRYMI